MDESHPSRAPSGSRKMLRLNDVSARISAEVTALCWASEDGTTTLKATKVNKSRKIAVTSIEKKKWEGRKWGKKYGLFRNVGMVEVQRERVLAETDWKG